MGQNIGFWLVLEADNFDHFNREWIKLRNDLKRRPSAGKVIASKSFGFWQRLFEPRYDAHWSANASALLWAAFPHHPRRGVQPADWLTRSKVQRRIKLFVDMRNRAMHHESIFQGIARPDEQQPGRPIPMIALFDAHQQIHEFLGWIDPQLVGALDIVDRFPDIHTNGRHDIESKLRAEVIRISGHL